ncbi:uncharacterized protein KRP23_10941 [Phytophthora ramorum]|uniref:uncharacterized protein n=1 Tax=Phytophthora ramorum TaxID=164328 RepID=UPI00309DB4C9|nr:hypothetical protein KRP23_10941 [Phytophthora ramorum]
MNDVRLPPRAEELVKCFVGIHERIDYYFVAVNEDLWITQLCAPTYEEVAALFEGASAYTHPDLIRLLYRDDRYETIRDRKVRLVDALESHSPRAVVEELFKHLNKFTAEDRARSFLLLASELPTSVAEDASEERTEWLDRIADSFEASPRALRLQLLLAASIVGHEPMVSLLLGDIAAGDELAPNIDAVEAECLIEAAMNQHYPIVKEFLVGGRFSTGNETRWSAVVQALEVSCTNGSTDIAGILLPHYLSYYPVVSAGGAHHLRLLRLALANWHFEIVELLLECDPRGTLCNMMGIIDALRAEVAQGFSGAASRSEVLSIVVGEEHDGVGDLVRWDAAALARGISSENTTLVRFLVNHIRLCREELEVALETAQAIGNLEMVEIISPRLQMSADPSEGIDSENEGMVASSPSIDSDSPNAEPDESQANTDQQSESDDSNQLELEKRSTARFDSSDGDSDNSVSVTDASPHMICPRPTESLEALRTVSLEAVEQAISSARLFVVLKRIDIASDDLVQVSLENVGEPDCDDSLTDLQQFDTTCSAEKLSWLRQYSRKTVDQILREGKLAATKQGVEASIDACNIDQTDAEDRSLPMMAVMNENGSGSVVIGCGQPTVQDETPLAESIHVEDCTIDCRALGILDQNGEEEWNHVGPGEIVIPVGIVDESLSAGDEAVSAESAETQAIVPETSGIVDSVVADAEGEDFNCECVVSISTEMVENQFPESSDFVGDNECVIADDEHSKAILFDNNTSVEKASKEDDASERQVYEALTALMTQLPTVTPPSDPVDTTQNDVKDVGVNQDDDGLAEAESPAVAGYEHVDAGTHKAPCSKPLSMSICTSLPSPTRATIICPVKWIEHAINLPETSACAENYSPPLREGDRVQVRYEARSALFTGVIIYCHSNGAYDIVYEDGEEESCVPREYIQLVEPLQIGCHEDLQNANEQIGDAQTFPQDEPLDEPHLSSESSLGSASSDDTYQQQTHFENDSVTATCNSRNGEENLQEKDAIVPVVIPTVFSVDKRFLCEIATEVLDAIILHCSGRKLALLFLQLGETYSKYEDLRLYNLTSVYVDKCVRNWSKSEVASLESSESSTVLLTLLAKSLLSKSAPVRISAQKSLRHLRNELGSRRFEDVVRAHVPQDLEALVLTECRDASTGSTRSSIRRDASRRREAEKKTNTRSPTIVQSGPSILQRMLLQRQNRVLPTQT